VSELVFLFSADADIQKAYELYENWQEGRGTVFMLHLDVAFAYLRRFSEIGPVFHGNYRRLLVPHFPCGIFYSIEGKRIIIAAVMDTRQDPDAIIRRLE
jgi:plasmid stabilization system protein ParE